MQIWVKGYDSEEEAYKVVAGHCCYKDNSRGFSSAMNMNWSSVQCLACRMAITDERMASRSAV